MTAGRRIALAFVGGGRRSLIGGVHRAAAALSERFALKGGVFGTDPERERAWARALGRNEAMNGAAVMARPTAPVTLVATARNRRRLTDASSLTSCSS